MTTVLICDDRRGVREGLTRVMSAVPGVSRIDCVAHGDELLARYSRAPVDVVLVGDLFYERPLAERVLAFVQAAHKGGAEVLVGDPRRSYFPSDRFRQVALYSVPVTRELEDAEIKRSAVWRLA